MIDKDLQAISLDLSRLTRALPEQLQQQAVTALIIALGSNYQADYYLAMVRKSLATLGDIRLSTAFKNPDYTATVAQPKPDYTNQCIYLALTQSMTLEQLQPTFKDFEADCHRQRLSEHTDTRRVTMDIDILLVTLNPKKNSLSDISKLNWVIMADRYPFKTHELIGVAELVKAGL